MVFREDIFVRAMIERGEDAKMMSTLFAPEWLGQAALQPILAEIYEFTRKKHIPPSVDTLRQIFEAKDPEMYRNRISRVLDDIAAVPDDPSQFMFAVDRARGVAVTRSFQRLVSSPDFQMLQAENDGSNQISEVLNWVQSFENEADTVELNLKQSVDRVIANHDWDQGEEKRIRTGIPLIDEWSGGFLDKKQIAILAAPSGNGKSIFLGAVAHNVARQLDKKVLYITNELTTEEVTKRLLSKMTGQPISSIVRDPSLGLNKLDRHWKAGLQNHFRVVEVLKEVNANFIESLISKYRTLYSWKPDVVVIDYMERMKPNAPGIPREKTWIYLGQIAKDLFWACKRQDFLVWTAVQTNRSGFTAKEQDATQLQGSIQHLQEAALVIAMRKTGKKIGDDQSDIMQFKAIKVRHAADEGKAVYLKANLGKMQFTDERISEEEVVMAEGKKADPSKEVDTNDAPLKK